MATYNGSSTDDTVVGTVQDDVIVGGAGDDILSGGGGGTDRLEGGTGNDTYYSADYYGDAFIELDGEGIDTLIWTTGDCYFMAAYIEILRLASAGGITAIGNDQDNSIYGNDADNWLDGAGGNDVLIAGLGDDRLDGGAGANTLYGGEGADLYTVHSAADVVSEFAGEGVDTVHVLAAGDAFADQPYVLADNVENLVWDLVPTYPAPVSTMFGNALDNVITDGGYGNVIGGLGGNDQIYGDYMDDRLEGGDGDDYLVGGSHADTLNGGAGADMFVANAYMGQDVIEDFQIGRDRIALLDGVTVTSIVQRGADTLVTLDAFSGEDSMVLKGVRASDLSARDFVVDAQPHDPRIDPGSPVPGQTLAGGAGFDFIRGDWGDDTLAGNDGNDDLRGNVGNDVISGGAGDDVIDGEQGADRMAGDLGNDVFLVRDAGDAVIEQAGEGIDQVRTYLDDYTLAANVERLDLGLGAAITATGNAGDNLIAGNTLDNRLFGSGGDDDLLGGAGADLLVGGDGDDRLDGGTDGPGNEGNGYANIGDTLTGGAGADRFVVGFRYENGFDPSGADIVTDFTDGEDLIEVWGATSWRSIESVTNADGTVDTLVVFDDMDYFDATLLLKGIGPDQITVQDFIFGFDGTSFADTMIGTRNNDRLAAGAGNDLLDGGAGSDQLIGGTGNDTYVAGRGDAIVETAGEGRDTVRSAGSFVLGANVENLVLTDAAAAAGLSPTRQALARHSVDGTGNALGNVIDGSSGANRIEGMGGNDKLGGNAGADSLKGGDGDDRLSGGIGADQLSGGTGHDVLIGGSGADRLSGGTGADTFAFQRLTDSGDMILDFKARAGDVIDLSALDANVHKAGDQRFSMVAAFSGHAGEAFLSYDAVRNQTMLRLDVDGDGASDFNLTIDGSVPADMGFNM